MSRAIRTLRESSPTILFRCARPCASTFPATRTARWSWESATTAPCSRTAPRPANTHRFPRRHCPRWRRSVRVRRSPETRAVACGTAARICGSSGSARASPPTVQEWLPCSTLPRLSFPYLQSTGITSLQQPGNDVVHRNRSHGPSVFIHYRQHSQIVLVEKLENFLLPGIRRDAQQRFHLQFAQRFFRVGQKQLGHGNGPGKLRGRIQQNDG